MARRGIGERHGGMGDRRSLRIPEEPGPPSMPAGDQGALRADALQHAIAADGSSLHGDYLEFPGGGFNNEFLTKRDDPGFGI